MNDITLERRLNGIENRLGGVEDTLKSLKRIGYGTLAVLGSGAVTLAYSALGKALGF